MGGLVGGIFDLAEGNPTGGEQKQLAGLGDYEQGTGEGLTTAGAGFDESILSGDSSKIASTLAPEISGQQGQIQQQELQTANFGNRSGGSTASTEAAPTAGRANIINLEGGLQQGTAAGALGAGGGLLGQASSNIGTDAELAAANQKRMTGDVSGIAQSAAAIAAPFLGGAAPASSTPQPWAPPDYLQQTGNAMSLASDDEVGADPFGWNS